MAFYCLILLNGCCTLFPSSANCPCKLSVAPTSLIFGTSEDQKSFVVSNAGGRTLTWTVSEKPDWISCSPNSGSESQTVLVTLNRALLAVGSNSGNIVVASPDGGVASIDVTATGEPRELTYTISVSTGDIDGGGTNANVYVEIWGMKGTIQTYSGSLQLDNPGIDDFERGHTDNFTFAIANLGEVRKVCIRHDNSNDHPGWYLSAVKVSDNLGRNWTFSFNQWLATDEPPGQLSACRGQ